MAKSAELQANRKALVGSKNTLTKRVTQLTKIKNVIENDLIGEPPKINSAISLTNSNLNMGLVGATSKSSIDTELQKFEQKSITSDGEISKVWSNIVDEINRCNREISSLDTQISNTDQAIKTAKENEAKAAAK